MKSWRMSARMKYTDNDNLVDRKTAGRQMNDSEMCPPTMKDLCQIVKESDRVLTLLNS